MPVEDPPTLDLALIEEIEAANNPIHRAGMMARMMAAPYGMQVSDTPAGVSITFMGLTQSAFEGEAAALRLWAAAARAALAE